MEPINLVELFEVVGQYIQQIAGDPMVGNVAQSVTVSLAVVSVIVRGARWWMADQPWGQFVLETMLRLGLGFWLLANYETFIYGYLFRGLINLAPGFGSLEALNMGFNILLGAMGSIAVAGLAAALASGGTSLIVAGVLFVLAVTAYIGMVSGGLIALMMAGGYVVVGKLLIWAIFFDTFQPWFLTWLKGLIGALLGLLLWHFFLGAMIEIPYWQTLEGAVQTISDIPSAIGKLLNIVILFGITGMLSLAAPKLGQAMV